MIGNIHIEGKSYPIDSLYLSNNGINIAVTIPGKDFCKFPVPLPYKISGEDGTLIWDGLLLALSADVPANATATLVIKQEIDGLRSLNYQRVYGGEEVQLRELLARIEKL